MGVAMMRPRVYGRAGEYGAGGVGCVLRGEGEGVGRG